MLTRIDRREFMKQSVVATAAFAASPASIYERGRESSEIDKAAIRKFASHVRGQVIAPDDPGYASACQELIGNRPQKPGIIVRSAGSNDIADVVNFARDHELPLAIRCGGHGLRLARGGVLIDLSGMKRIEVDVAQRVAKVQAGVKLGEFDKATCAHGLAAVLGECPSVGISGFALGGGLGRLMGQFGSLCDNLLSAEIITSDGRLVRASATENPDLFWAIRGGSGNFGIVTSFCFRLHPVGSVLAGMLQYPIANAPAILRFFREYMSTAPDSLDALIEIGSSVLQYAPDAQEPIVVINVCCGDDLHRAEETLRPLRKFGPPIVDTIRPMPYVEAQALGGNLSGTLRYATAKYSGYFKTGFVTQLSDAAIEAVVAHCEKPPSSAWSVAFDHYLHGKICRIPTDAMAFSLRQPGYSFRLTSFQEGDQPDRSSAWVKTLHEALKPFSAGRIYLNYITDEGTEGVRAAFATNYARLTNLKKRYDPTNFFQLNPNVEPAP
jgi:FAD binding domain/Berberine and berberine like